MIDGNGDGDNKDGGRGHIQQSSKISSERNSGSCGCGGGGGNVGGGNVDNIFFNSDIAFYIGIIQTSFLMKFPKSYGGTGIVIPVKNTPQEQIKQESGGFL